MGFQDKAGRLVESETPDTVVQHRATVVYLWQVTVAGEVHEHKTMDSRNNVMTRQNVPAPSSWKAVLPALHLPLAGEACKEQAVKDNPDLDISFAVAGCPKDVAIPDTNVEQAPGAVVRMPGRSCASPQRCEKSGI